MNNFTYMTDKNFSKGRKYIGASNVWTLTGQNQYETPFELWEVMTGRKVGFTGNFKSAEGHFKEAGILGKKLAYDQLLKDVGPDYTADDWLKAISSERINNFIVSRLWEENQFDGLHSWTEAIGSENKRHVAHADLLDLNRKVPMITQAKNTGMIAANTRKRNPFKGYSADDLSQNGVPMSVYLQEQFEMYCYGLPYAEVAVEIGGNDWRLYGPIEYRKKDVEKLVVLADRMLWHVDKDKPPTPQSWPDVLSMFPDLEKNTKSTVSGQDELDTKKMISQIAKIDEKRRLLDKAKLDRIMGISLFACEPDLSIMHNYLTSSDGTELASFSEIKGQWRINYNKVASNPELLAQCESIGAVSQDATRRQATISGANAGTVDLWTLVTFPDGKDEKPNRKGKKFTTSEKKDIGAVLKKSGSVFDWERYSTR